MLPLSPLSSPRCCCPQASVQPPSGVLGSLSTFRPFSFQGRTRTLSFPRCARTPRSSLGRFPPLPTMSRVLGSLGPSWPGSWISSASRRVSMLASSSPLLARCCRMGPGPGWTPHGGSPVSSLRLELALGPVSRSASPSRRPPPPPGLAPSWTGFWGSGSAALTRLCCQPFGAGVLGGPPTPPPRLRNLLRPRLNAFGKGGFRSGPSPLSDFWGRPCSRRGLPPGLSPTRTPHGVSRGFPSFLIVPLPSS